jgi:lipopolysaccharide export system protein LptA
LRWQKVLRWLIAAFVVVFAAVVVVSLRRGHTRSATPPQVKQLPPNATFESTGPIEFASDEKGKRNFAIEARHQISYDDGHSVFDGAVKVTIPDRSGRSITIQGDKADVMVPPGKTISTGVFTGNVKLTTSDGVTVEAASASYDDTTQVTTIPGAMTFSKGRMAGSATGATYDQNRAVLWLLADAKVDAKPDEKGGGAIHVTAKQAGMARLEHYLKFIGDARLDGEGHVTTSDEATAYLTPDDDRITRMELRGNSRITSKSGGGPQDMRARDIDMTYAEDGRTLQGAHMVENAVVRLPAENGKPGKQIAGKGIDISLAPDGETVTNLTAADSVQVDLPPDGDIPARRIRSAILVATGAPPAAPGQPGGIKAASFGGGVEYREHRDAKGKLTLIDRTAKSDKLDIQTKPGFGDLERADFHANVHFTDGPQTTADAPFAIYSIKDDSLTLNPGSGEAGKPPHVTDGRVSIDAKNIQMALTAQKMKADTNVRSVMIQQQGKAGGDTVKVPSMLKQDRPVYIKSNRLDYDSGASLATYEGASRLWQDGDDGSTILADKIIIDDKTGNLHAITNVTTSTFMTTSGQPDKPNTKKADPTVTTSTEMVYEDARHRAIYTGGVHMNGPDGDMTSDTLELFFTEQGGQLDHAEAEGNVVSRQTNRRAFGKHLSYRAKDDVYTMTGAPAMVYDDTAPNCKLTKAPTVAFRKDVATGSATGNGTFGQKSEAIACGSAPGSL